MLGFPSKHQELARMVISILNNKEEQRCGSSVGDSQPTRFLQRHPQIDTTVARAMDRDQVPVVNATPDVSENAPHVTALALAICGTWTSRDL